MEHDFTFSDSKLPPVQMIFFAVLAIPAWVGNFARKRAEYHLNEYEIAHGKENLILFVLYEFVTLLCITPLLTIVFNLVMSMEDFDLDEDNWKGFMLIFIVLMFAPALMGAVGFLLLRRTEHHLMQYKETHKRGNIALSILWGILTLTCFTPLTIFLVFHLKETLL